MSFQFSNAVQGFGLPAHELRPSMRVRHPAPRATPSNAEPARAAPPVAQVPPPAYSGATEPIRIVLEAAPTFRYSTKTPSRNNKDDLIQKSKRIQDRCIIALDIIVRDIEEFNACIVRAKEQKEFIKLRLEREIKIVESIISDELLVDATMFVEGM